MYKNVYFLCRIFETVLITNLYLSFVSFVGAVLYSASLILFMKL